MMNNFKGPIIKVKNRQELDEMQLKFPKPVGQIYKMEITNNQYESYINKNKCEYRIITTNQNGYFFDRPIDIKNYFHLLTSDDIYEIMFEINELPDYSKGKHVK